MMNDKDHISAVRGKDSVVYKVALTGGPCGGKTTGQDRLATFFESLGWKVFRVPETATILLAGGVKFDELDEEEQFGFQEDLLLTMIKLEDTFVHLAESCSRNCLVICDRGTMDPRAYIDLQCWNRIMKRNNLNSVDLRDNRYNQIVHMVTAADGAEKFYTLSNNITRHESTELARVKDKMTREVWLGHPYVDFVTNDDTRNFDDKILKLIQVVCDRAGVSYGDRLARNSVKRKWLVVGILEDKFSDFQEFDVIHDYLLSENPSVQSRIRKRGQDGKWNYSSTICRLVKGEKIETRMQISKREYEALRVQRDVRRSTTYKRRRCFMLGNQYFQLDVYSPPLPPQSPDPNKLMILETFTTIKEELEMPEFLRIGGEVTGDPVYSMYNLSTYISPVINGPYNQQNGH